MTICKYYNSTGGQGQKKDVIAGDGPLARGRNANLNDKREGNRIRPQPVKEVQDIMLNCSPVPNYEL